MRAIKPIRTRMPGRRKTILTILIGAAIILWCIYILKLAVFRSFPLDHAGPHAYNLIPFESIAKYLVGKHMNDNIRVINLLGNIGVFIPIGLAAPIIFRKMDPFKSALVSAAGFSLIIEILQGITGQGVMDIDDLILNLCGGLVGYLAFWFGRRIGDR